MTKATPKTEFTSEFPFLKQLVEMYGVMEAGRMIGLTNIGTAMKDLKVRPAYEMAAELCIRNLTPREDRMPCSYLVKLTPEQKKVILPLLESMDVTFMDLEF